VDVSLTMWAATIAAILLLLAMDFVIGRNPHDVSMREATLWSVFYIAVAIGFGLVVWNMSGSDFATEYYTAWLVEKSLSVDNLFVFVIIFARFAVPSELQQRALLIGVALALVLRAVFIAIGAAALEAFAITFAVFGAFLIWTAVQLFRHRNQDADIDDNKLLTAARRRLPMTEAYVGNKLWIKEGARRLYTPMFLVLLAIGSTDLLFALDSIPATFGVTSEPYLVFAANAFALLGLRALFFVLRGLLDKLIYLSVGLSVILGFIGVKLILTYLHELNDDIPKIQTFVSLAVIIGVLALTTVASLVKARRDPSAHAHSGALHGPRRSESGDGTPSNPQPGQES